MTQIIFFLSHYLFGIIEDNVSLLVYPDILTNWADNKILLSGYPFGQTIPLFRDNQPIFQMIFYFMSSWLNTVLVLICL